jgi:hypothetical protein
MWYSPSTEQVLAQSTEHAPPAGAMACYVILSIEIETLLDKRHTRPAIRLLKRDGDCAGKV